MAPPSNISQLPDDLVEALNQRLSDSKYHDIDGHTDWLNEQIKQRSLDIEAISRSAVGRYSRMRKLQTMSVQESVQELRSYQKLFGDDPLAFVEGGNQLTQELAWKLLQAVRNGDVEMDEEILLKIARAFNLMSRTSQINEKRERDIRENERALAKEEAAKAAVGSARKAGVSPETIEAIRRDVLGMS